MWQQTRKISIHCLHPSLMSRGLEVRAPAQLGQVWHPADGRLKLRHCQSKAILLEAQPAQSCGCSKRGRQGTQPVTGQIQLLQACKRRVTTAGQFPAIRTTHSTVARHDLHGMQLYYLLTCQIVALWQVRESSPIEIQPAQRAKRAYSRWQF
jgi:hypothetical protein